MFKIIWILGIFLIIARIYGLSNKNILSVYNFTDFIGGKNKSIVYFYAEKYAKMTKFTDLYEKIAEMNFQKYNFYKIDGPTNQEIIQYYKELKNFPSLAYFDSYSANISQLYQGNFNENDMNSWIKNMTVKNENNTDKLESENCKKIFTKTSEITEKSNLISRDFLGLNFIIEDSNNLYRQKIWEYSRKYVPPQAKSMTGKELIKAILINVFIFCLGLIVGTVIFAIIFKIIKKNNAVYEKV